MAELHLPATSKHQVVEIRIRADENSRLHTHLVKAGCGSLCLVDWLLAWQGTDYEEEEQEPSAC